MTNRVFNSSVNELGFYVKSNLFREINLIIREEVHFTKYFYFSKSMDIVNFRHVCVITLWKLFTNFYCWLPSKPRNFLSLIEEKISSNQLSSNFFSKTVTFTKVLLKSCKWFHEKNRQIEKCTVMPTQRISRIEFRK